MRLRLLVLQPVGLEVTAAEGVEIEPDARRKFNPELLSLGIISPQPRFPVAAALRPDIPAAENARIKGAGCLGEW